MDAAAGVARLRRKDANEGRGNAGLRSGCDQGEDLRLHRHPADAIRMVCEGHNYVLTTGTGSGKSLAYIIPIVDQALRCGPGRGIQAIIVYPMNALVNSTRGPVAQGGNCRFSAEENGSSLPK